MAVTKRVREYISKKTGRIKKVVTYEVTYNVGIKANGKPNVKSKSFPKKEQADKFDALKRTEKTEGCILQNRKITFNRFIDEWQNDTKNSRTEKTKENDNYILERIREKLGCYDLKDLNPRILKDFYNYLESIGSLSSETIYKHYNKINLLLKYAIKMQYIKYNYNEGLYKKDPTQKKEIEVFTEDEVLILTTNLVNECIKYRALIQVSMDIIGRRGEVTGLEWDDIDWENNTITVNKETQAIKGKGIMEINRTKTDSSNRIVEVSPRTMIVLAEYKKYQDELKVKLGNKWGNSKKIFTTDDGRNMYPKTPYSILKRLEKKYGLNPNVSFHAGIRHTTYSWLLANSEVEEYSKISRRGGHKDLSVTLRLYNHVISNDNTNILKSMDKMFGIKD